MSTSPSSACTTSANDESDDTTIRVNMEPSSDDVRLLLDTDWACRRVLYLNSMKLRHVPDNIGELSQLETLNLHNNLLSSIPKEIGNLSSCLCKLNISDNNITSLPDAIGILSTLRVLDASSNELLDLPTSIGQLGSLEKLFLSHNRLTELPEGIGALRRLRVLDVRHNQITSIDRVPLTGLKALTHLLLDNNRIDRIAVSFAPLQHCLLVLSFARNFLTVLPTDVGALSSLKCLVAYKNRLSSLPQDLARMASLVYLDLGRNNLNKLPQQIGHVRALRHLRLERNLLCQIPSSIGSLSELRVLSLSSNQLSSLPLELGRLTNLCELYLCHNCLTSIAPQGTRPSPQVITSKSAVVPSASAASPDPELFADLPNLTVLSLRCNRLFGKSDSHATKVAISKLRNLRTLSIDKHNNSSVTQQQTEQQQGERSVLLMWGDKDSSLPSSAPSPSSTATSSSQSDQQSSGTPATGTVNGVTSSGNGNSGGDDKQLQQMQEANVQSLVGQRLRRTLQQSTLSRSSFSEDMLMDGLGLKVVTSSNAWKANAGGSSGSTGKSPRGGKLEMGDGSKDGVDEVRYEVVVLHDDFSYQGNHDRSATGPRSDGGVGGAPDGAAHVRGIRVLYNLQVVPLSQLMSKDDTDDSDPVISQGTAGSAGPSYIVGPSTTRPNRSGSPSSQTRSTSVVFTAKTAAMKSSSAAAWSSHHSAAASMSAAAWRAGGDVDLSNMSMNSAMMSDELIVGGTILSTSSSMLSPRLIHRLNLSGNVLTFLPKELVSSPLHDHVTSLLSLNLSNNHLQEVPPEIGMLTSLRALFLGNNRLRSLPDQVFKLRRLRWLSVRNNQLVSLPDSFATGLPQLRGLWLDGNSLSEIDISIGQLPRLEYLDCVDNNLKSLPDTIGQCVSLRSLWLDHNKLTSLPSVDVMRSLSRLECLSVSHNSVGARPSPELFEALPLLAPRGYVSPRFSSREKSLRTFVEPWSPLSLQRSLSSSSSSTSSTSLSSDVQHHSTAESAAAVVEDGDDCELKFQDATEFFAKNGHNTSAGENDNDDEDDEFGGSTRRISFGRQSIGRDDEITFNPVGYGGHGNLPTLDVSMSPVSIHHPITPPAQTAISSSAHGCPQVKGGSLRGLIKWMTHHGSIIDHAFIQTFLLTFRSFATPAQLFQELRHRFCATMGPRYASTVLPGHSVLADASGLARDKRLEEEFKRKVLVPVRVRIVNVLKLWIRLCPRDLHLDHSLRSEFVSFLDDIVAKAGMSTIADEIKGRLSAMLEMLQCTDISCGVVATDYASIGVKEQTRATRSSSRAGSALVDTSAQEDGDTSGGADGGTVCEAQRDVSDLLFRLMTEMTSSAPTGPSSSSHQHPSSHWNTTSMHPSSSLSSTSKPRFGIVAQGGGRVTVSSGNSTTDGTRGTLSLADIHPEEAARQMCLIEHALFRCVSSIELLSYSKASSAHKPSRPGKRSNSVSNGGDNRSRSSSESSRSNSDAETIAPLTLTDSGVDASDRDSGADGASSEGRASVEVEPLLNRTDSSSSTSSISGGSNINDARSTSPSSSPVQPTAAVPAHFINTLTKRFNEVSEWVVCLIVNEYDIEQRVKMIKHIIDIACCCLELRNFNGVMELVAGLQLAPVYRLKETWRRIGREDVLFYGEEATAETDIASPPMLSTSMYRMKTDRDDAGAGDAKKNKKMKKKMKKALKNEKKSGDLEYRKFNESHQRLLTKGEKVMLRDQQRKEKLDRERAFRRSIQDDVDLVGLMQGPYMKRFKRLCTIVSNEQNFRLLRIHHAQEHRPLLPYLGVVLMDLAFIQDGNPNFLPQDDDSPAREPFINFNKRRLLSRVLRDVRGMQRAPYPFSPVLFIRDFLLETQHSGDMNSLFEQSLRVEKVLDRKPRECRRTLARIFTGQVAADPERTDVMQLTKRLLIYDDDELTELQQEIHELLRKRQDPGVNTSLSRVVSAITTPSASSTSAPSGSPSPSSRSTSPSKIDPIFMSSAGALPSVAKPVSTPRASSKRLPTPIVRCSGYRLRFGQMDDDPSLPIFKRHHDTIVIENRTSVPIRFSFDTCGFEESHHLSIRPLSGILQKKGKKPSKKLKSGGSGIAGGNSSNTIPSSTLAGSGGGSAMGGSSAEIDVSLILSHLHPIIGLFFLNVYIDTLTSSSSVISSGGGGIVVKSKDGGGGALRVVGSHGGGVVGGKGVGIGHPHMFIYSLRPESLGIGSSNILEVPFSEINGGGGGAGDTESGGGVADGGEVIGSGAAGTVRRIMWNGSDVAVKRFRCGGCLSEEEWMEFRTELQTSCMLDHECVAKVLAVCLDPLNPCLVMEYFEMGGLDRLIGNESIPLDDKLVLKIGLDIARGMRHLHRRSMLHRDIKPGNILVHSLDITHPSCVQVADFGTARSMNVMVNKATAPHAISSSPPRSVSTTSATSPTTVEATPSSKPPGPMTGRTGTPQYMAPEMFLQSTHPQDRAVVGSDAADYTDKVDVYGFGVVMWELLSRRPVWEGKFAGDVENRVVRGERPAIDPAWPSFFQKLIGECFSHLPSSRPSFQQIVERMRAHAMRVDRRIRTKSMGRTVLAGVSGGGTAKKGKVKKGGSTIGSISFGTRKRSVSGDGTSPRGADDGASDGGGNTVQVRHRRSLSFDSPSSSPSTARNADDEEPQDGSCTWGEVVVVHDGSQSARTSPHSPSTARKIKISRSVNEGLALISKTGGGGGGAHGMATALRKSGTSTAGRMRINRKSAVSSRGVAKGHVGLPQAWMDSEAEMDAGSHHAAAASASAPTLSSLHSDIAADVAECDRHETPDTTSSVPVSPTLRASSTPPLRLSSSSKKKKKKKKKRKKREKEVEVSSDDDEEDDDDDEASASPALVAHRLPVGVPALNIDGGGEGGGGGGGAKDGGSNSALWDTLLPSTSSSASGEPTPSPSSSTAATPSTASIPSSRGGQMIQVRLVGTTFFKRIRVPLPTLECLHHTIITHCAPAAKVASYKAALAEEERGGAVSMQYSSNTRSGMIVVTRVTDSRTGMSVSDDVDVAKLSSSARLEAAVKYC